MDRINNILNNMNKIAIEASKIYKEQLNPNKSSKISCNFKIGDMIKNTDSSCMYYGSQGIVQDMEKLPDENNYIISYQTNNAGQKWKIGDTLKKHEDNLSFDGPSVEIEDEMQPEMFNETESQDIFDYKKDFFEMSVGSLRAVAQHSKNILDALDKPLVKENLTESWLQGKIAITEDYMRTIHDFVMYVSDADDTISAGDKPGLWDNIRKKKEKEGKNYRPSKPGDKDRPSPEMWKKLTKDK
jgi:hypothetical protein